MELSSGGDSGMFCLVELSGRERWMRRWIFSGGGMIMKVKVVVVGRTGENMKEEA